MCNFGTKEVFSQPNVHHFENIVSTFIFICFNRLSSQGTGNGEQFQKGFVQ